MIIYKSRLITNSKLKLLRSAICYVQLLRKVATLITTYFGLRFILQTPLIKEDVYSHFSSFSPALFFVWFKVCYRNSSSSQQPAFFTFSPTGHPLELYYDPHLRSFFFSSFFYLAWRGTVRRNFLALLLTLLHWFHLINLTIVEKSVQGENSLAQRRRDGDEAIRVQT